MSFQKSISYKNPRHGAPGPIGTSKSMSETRIVEVEEIKEVCVGYTFFWRGRKSEERREAGVSFASKSDLVGKHSGLPNAK